MLCHKLRDLAIAGKIGVWIHNVQKYRSLAVETNVASPTKTQIVSCVKQGRVPFIAAHSDMPSSAWRATLASYATDKKSHRTYRASAMLHTYSNIWIQSADVLWKLIISFMLENFKACATRLHN